MGFTSNTLDKMLLLGDPEAVVAIAYSRNVSYKIAESAWWAYQSPEIARKLLENKGVATGELGQNLAQFLL
ncbi:MAG: hypothetical protein GY706_05960, partial [Bacteroides sp.]|nr:hypothetical protein [Bacteroides sp.]